MERKFLEDLGLEKEAVDKILDANSADIGKAKKPGEEAAARITALEAQLSDANGTIDAMKAAAPNIEAVQNEAKEWKAKAEQAEAAAAAKDAELAKLTSRSETERMLSGQKFINDITRTHYVNAIETALDAPENKGKSREDIFKALTHDAEGKPNPGIFLEENPNRLQGPPPAGGGAPQEVTKEQFKAMDYKQMLDLANSNPQLYESLNKED